MPKTLIQWLDKLKAERKKERDVVNHEQRRYNVYAAASFVLLMGLIGVPQWWRTTRIYRASLPYGEIYQFKDAELVLPVAVSLVAGDATVASIFNEDNVAASVKEKVTEPFHRLKIDLEINERQHSEEEVALLKFKTPEELDAALNNASADAQEMTDGIEIFIFHRPDRAEVLMHFGTGSRIFVIGNFVREVRVGLPEILTNVIRHGYLRVDELSSIVERHTKGEVKPTSTMSKNGLSAGVLNPKLTVEVHVVDPEPVHCAQRFSVEHLVEDETIKKFLSSLRDITDISVKSQMLYYVDFSQEPVEDKRTGTRYLNPAQLQHMINPIETYLGTVVTTEPVYHMLLYIPSPIYRPLMVPYTDRHSLRVTSETRPAPYNSFVVSGWGSVTVVNVERRCKNGKLSVDNDSMKGAKKAIVANLRKFFGLEMTKGFHRTPSAVLADWELQSLRYRAVVEYMFSSIRTLNSLTKLLGEITNIVINDDIGASIATAVDEMKNAVSASTSGVGGVPSMLESASRAFQLADKAFFDPSLLALLYFPDDQKYAIYIPLFLPIGVPVLGSIAFIWKYYKEIYKNKQPDAL